MTMWSEWQGDGGLSHSGELRRQRLGLRGVSDTEEELVFKVLNTTTKDSPSWDSTHGAPHDTLVWPNGSLRG